MKSEVAQLCLTLWDPMDYSLPGSSIHGVVQPRVLEWVTISFSRDLLNPEVEPKSPTLQVVTLPSEPPGMPIFVYNIFKITLYKWHYTVFVFLELISLSTVFSRSVHIVGNGITLFLFWLTSVYMYYYCSFALM